MLRRRRYAWLAIGNVVALPVLSLPAFGFIAYMNRHGIAEFVLVAWLAAGSLAILSWPRVPGSNGPKGFMLSLLSTFVPVVLAWAFALRGLYAPEEEVLLDLWRWAQGAVLLGGPCTAAYWVPASIVNWLFLRRAA